MQSIAELTMERLGTRFKLNNEPLSNEDRLRAAQAKADRFNSERGNLPDYDCKECLNRGQTMKVVFDNRWNMIREIGEECKCMKIRHAIWRMKASGLEKSIKRCRFDNFEASESWQRDLLTLAKDYAQEPQGWLFIGGQVGCGKTHLCTAACRELLLKGVAVIYMSWVTDVADLKANAMESEIYQKQIRSLKTAEVLYIDDLFKPTQGQEPTAADIRIAYDIINYRYCNQLPTIVSSEHSIHGLVQIDEATGSRIYEMSKDHNMSIRRSPDRDYRLKGATEK